MPRTPDAPTADRGGSRSRDASSNDASSHDGGSKGAGSGRTGWLRRGARWLASNAWGERGQRVGLAARGVVYLVLGYLVASIAMGALGDVGPTSKPASGPGVAQAIAAQPDGKAVLLVLGVGLLLYAVFSAQDAILHHDDESPSAKRWGDRALSAWGVVVYGAFGIYCFVTAASSSGGDQTSRATDRQHTQWSADVLRWPAGWFLLGLLGTVLLLIAVFLVTRAARRSFRPRLDLDAMGPLTRQATMVCGTVGYLGRAGLFAMVGWFTLHAAIENDPTQGQGVDGAVQLLAGSRAGPYLLWALAIALVLYGLYMFIESRYRHV